MTRPTDISAEIWERADLLRDQFQKIEDDTEFVARILMEVESQPAIAGLTPIQAGALGFINRFQTEKGYSPSYREVADGCGMASKSGAHRVIHELVDRGALHMLPGRGRSVTLVGRA